MVAEEAITAVVVALVVALQAGAEHPVVGAPSLMRINHQKKHEGLLHLRPGASVRRRGSPQQVTLVQAALVHDVSHALAAALAQVQAAGSVALAALVEVVLVEEALVVEALPAVVPLVVGE